MCKGLVLFVHLFLLLLKKHMIKLECTLLLIYSTASIYSCILCGVWTNILQEKLTIDDLQVHKQKVSNFHSSSKEYIQTKYIHIKFRNHKRLLHNKLKTKDFKHQFLGHGSPSTISISLGRGGFAFLALVGVLGLGLDDCGLSGVDGGLLCGSSSSDDVQRKGETSSIGDGGLIGIQAGSSNDSEDDGDLGDITSLPL